MLDIIDEALFSQHGHAIDMTELIFIVKVAEVVECFCDGIVLNLWQLILLFFQVIISVVIWLRYDLYSVFFIFPNRLLGL